MYGDLIRRVLKLERLLRLEAKQDQETLRNFLGEEYYDKYLSIKNKIRDPEYKDIYKLIKKDPNEVKEYIDNIKSNTDKRRSSKDSGAKLLFKNSEWKVYRITTYEAAKLYGSNTKWCITGRYAGHEDRGEHYFNDYIEREDLDGGYYFFIKSDGEKYCILRQRNGMIQSIWNAEDNVISIDSLFDLEPTIPSVKGYFDFDDAKLQSLLLSGDYDLIKKAIELGVPKDYITEAQTRYMYHEKYLPIMELLVSNGADPSYADYVAVDHYIRDDDTIGLEIFLKNGLDPNTITITKRSLIEKAVRLDSLKCAELLLKYGANPNPERRSKDSLLSFAENYSSDDMVELLKQYGAE